MRLKFKIKNLVAYILFTLVVAFVLFPVLPFEDIYDLKLVTAGSMEPTIPQGSVILIYQKDDYEIGDIVTFSNDLKGGNDTYVTHRIVRTTVNSGEKQYTTRGDANEYSDFDSIVGENVKGKVLFHIPYAHSVLEFIKKPIGISLLIVLPTIFIIADFIRNRRQAVKESDDEGEGL
ncbi:MAG: signal peptidase I [Parcubacteria group bacterium CG11_big_fil_rev_8_21_14_0_20_39_22]|nr:MAG: signal peptidase I [Parcubacteria group bacterium CG11_big_fil_rev_8_21_14_0_20_39_22]